MAMSAATVFAPSLLGGKQEAVLGLHDSWSATRRNTGHAPPPPPLMVMMAAMLRSKHLDDVRLAPSRPSVDVNDANVPALRQEDRERLVTLVASGDVDACREVHLVPITTTEERSWGVFQLYSFNYYTFHECYLASLRTGNAAALGVAIQHVIEFYSPLKNHHPNKRQINSKLYDVEPFRRQDFNLEAVRDVLSTVINQDMTDSVSAAQARAQAMARVLRQCRDDQSLRQAQLRCLGDLRCLLLSHRNDTDVTPLLQRVVRDSDPDDAILSLAELGHADMSSMVLAVLGSVPTTLPFKDVYHNTRTFEMRYIASRHVMINISQGVPSLMAAHDSTGRAVVRIAAPLSDDTHHVLLRDGWPPTAPTGSAAYRDRAAFEARWAAQLRGLLDGWDWSHCIAAGGAVVRALVGRDGQDDNGDPFGDVDLFFHGLTFSGVRARLAALERHVHILFGPERYAVLLTSKTMTIVIEGAPRLQVALGMWSSASDVLVNSDVDCCGAGYDGSRVVLTGRAAAAYAYRVNVGSASAHRVRGSPAYETRLWKYAKRYGFAVLDPLHAPHCDAVVDARTVVAGDFAKKARVAAARQAATSLKGLRWLLAADLGLFTPTLTTDLALAEGEALSDVLATVSSNGYVESDNYGTHEEGYVVVQQAAVEEPFDMEFLTDGNYLQSHTRITTAKFANSCMISDLDYLELDEDEPNKYTNSWNLLADDDDDEAEDW